MRLLVLFTLLLPFSAFAESVLRDPVDFLRKNLMDFRLGPGYTAYENVRVHGKDTTGAHHGPIPLYDFRIGPVNITNIYDQAAYTRGKGLRVGILFNYTGDSYEAQGLAKRSKSLYGGGFIGYSFFTAFAYSDLLDKKAGTLYMAKLAPMLFKMGKGEVFLVFDFEHMNRLYVDYYFGIRKIEATPVLTYYEGIPTNNYAGTLLFVYTISKNVEFLLWGGEKRYGVGVTNSPTVGLKHEYRAGIGWVFRII